MKLHRKPAWHYLGVCFCWMIMGIAATESSWVLFKELISSINEIEFPSKEQAVPDSIKIPSANKGIALHSFLPISIAVALFTNWLCLRYALLWLRARRSQPPEA